MTLWDPWTIAGQVPLSKGFSRQEYWSGCWKRKWQPTPVFLPGEWLSDWALSNHSLPLGIFPTQGLNLVSCIAGGFFTIWATILQLKKEKKNNEKTKWNNTKTKIPENSTSLFQSSTFAFPCQSCTWTGIGNFHFISPLFWASSFPISSMTEILCLQENNYLQHRPSQTISNKRRVCWKLVKKSHRIENQEIQLILTRKSLIFHTSFSWSPMIFPLLIFLSFEISLFFLQAGFLFLLLC